MPRPTAGGASAQLRYERVEGVGGLTSLLAESDTAERQRVYRSAGVHLRLHRSEEGERVTASLRAGLLVSEGDSNLLRWVATQST